MEHNQNTEVEIVPEHILKNLRKHQHHEEQLCLECGYKGMMGVTKKYKNSAYNLTIFIVVSLLLLISDFFMNLFGLVVTGSWFTVILIVFLGLGLINKSLTSIYHCPNCERELYPTDNN